MDDYQKLAEKLFPGSRYIPSRGNIPRVALAGADHEASLLGAAEAAFAGMAEFILFGERERIVESARHAGISLDKFTLVNCGDHEEAAGRAASAAAAGKADVLMKGGVHTSVFTKAFLDKSRGLVPKGGLISHVALFLLPGYYKPLMLTDGAINIAPDLEQKKRILINAVAAAAALGNKAPAAALICPVETINPKIASTIDAAELVKLHGAENCFGEALVEGPMALDAALSADAAAVKGIAGKVPGHPDILLLPGLDAGNALYKAFSLQPGSLTAGIIAGLRVPVVLTSRSDSKLTRYLSLYMALSAAAGSGPGSGPGSRQGGKLL